MWPQGKQRIMDGWLYPRPEGWQACALHALEEDLGTGDLSSVCFDSEAVSSWEVLVQADGVLCGTGLAAWIFTQDQEGILKAHASDGGLVAEGECILSGELSTSLLLARERTALNFLMHLSGVASLTARFVEQIQGTRAKIVDTRKTLPGLRRLQKYGVRCGGGQNHRMGLYDALMIKDNHIKACGSIRGAVEKARGKTSHTAKIEVECETLGQVAEAVSAGADIIMLDNMPLDLMREAVSQFGERCVLEASGGVNLQTVDAIASTGVHYISVGALTHSAPALPFHLEIR